MSIYSSRAVQGYGYFGQAFGASAFDLFPGSPGFQGADTYNNWAGGNKWHGSADVADIGYSPVTKGVLNAAAAKWAAIGQSMNPADTDYQERIKGLLAAQIASADALAANHSITGDYNRSTTASMINAFKQINTLIKQVAVYQVKAQPDTLGQGDTQGTAINPVSGRQASVRDPAGVPGDNTSGYRNTQGEGESDNTMLYAGLALGAVALIAGGIYFMRSSKKMSGYRRRRRR